MTQTTEEFAAEHTKAIVAQIKRIALAELLEDDPQHIAAAIVAGVSETKARTIGEAIDEALKKDSD